MGVLWFHINDPKFMTLRSFGAELVSSYGNSSSSWVWLLRLLQEQNREEAACPAFKQFLRYQNQTSIYGSFGNWKCLQTWAEKWWNWATGVTEFVSLCVQLSGLQQWEDLTPTRIPVQSALKSEIHEIWLLVGPLRSEMSLQHYLGERDVPYLLVWYSNFTYLRWIKILN